MLHGKLGSSVKFALQASGYRAVSCAPEVGDTVNDEETKTRFSQYASKLGRTTWHGHWAQL